MNRHLNPQCERICGASLHVEAVAFEVTKLEENALESGCDVIGGEVSCAGPRLIVAEGDVETCTVTCNARCSIPEVENSTSPAIASEIGKQIRAVVDDVFEYPRH